MRLSDLALIALIASGGAAIGAGANAVLGVIDGGTGNRNGDISQLVMIPTGGSDYLTAADLASRVLGTVSIQGSGVDGHIPILGNCIENSGSCQIRDSGAVLSLSYRDILPPGVNQSSAQGYHTGDIGFSSQLGQFYGLISDTPGAANWQPFTAALAQPQTIAWTFSQMTSAASGFTSIGGTSNDASVGVNQNFVNIVKRPGTFSSLSVHLAQAPGTASPGTGKTATYVLWLGLPFHLVATSFSCTVTDLAFDCPDNDGQTIHAAKGQAWVLVGTISAGGSPTGQGSSAMLFTPD